MKEEKQNKMKKSTKYLLIGTLVLFLSILGASMAYYLARVSGNLSGRAAGTELAINVQKISSNANMDLIPLDNDLETLNLAAAGYQDNGACVDINGYSVCQIYHITLTNNGSVPLTVNGTVTLSGQNVPNIDCATMSDATTVANNNSCMGGNVFVSGDTLNANNHNDYYVMVYIKNLDEPQTDSGEFNGTITFISEDGRKVKGRFTKPFNLVQRIQTLYNVNNNDLVTTTTKTPVTNNSIEYNYATNVGLMKDRLGGTTTSLDGGNIRYYGAEPNNWIDIGDKYETDVQGIKGFEQYASDNGVDISELPFTTSDECYAFYNCESNYQELGFETVSECNNNLQDGMQQMGFESLDQFCSGETTPAGTPILWRIIGVFDGKLRIRRDESIGDYSYDTSASNVNDGMGINEWSQADYMKLLNPGYENNQDLNNSNETITVNNSLWWNGGSGKCYNGQSYANTDCDFTNSGLSEEAKEYVIDQTIYLGGYDNDIISAYANDAWTTERGNNVFNNTKSCYGQSDCNDGVKRTLTWTGKVGLIYPSDFGYAADFGDSNCQGLIHNFSRCTANWMAKGISLTISPFVEHTYTILGVGYGNITDANVSLTAGGWPTLLLDSSVLAESGNGSKSTPYVVAY